MNYKIRWIIESVYFYCGRENAIEIAHERHAPVQEQEGWITGDTVTWERPETIWSPEHEPPIHGFRSAPPDWVRSSRHG